MDNAWLEAHNKRLSLAMHDTTRAISGVWLSLLHAGTIDAATLANLRQRSENLKVTTDLLQAELFEETDTCESGYCIV